MTSEASRRSIWARAVHPFTLLPLAFGAVVFMVALQVWDTNNGALVAAIVGAVAAALSWLAIRRFTGERDLMSSLRHRVLGHIPDSNDPAPTLTDPLSSAAMPYRDVYTDLESHTTGQVVLVTSPAPGHGSTTVALNLAVAATLSGRRVLLVDGDLEGNGLTRYMSTGPSPGLGDLATGSATLQDATRLWNIGAGSLLPVIPAGSRDTDPEVLGGGAVAEAIGRVGEQADLVIIDTPPILWNGSSTPLAAHADGSLLVVTSKAAVDQVGEAEVELENAGAPVFGYVVNRSNGPRPWRKHPVLRFLERVAIIALLMLFAYTAWTGYQLWDSWRAVDREGFDVSQAERLLPLPDVPLAAAEVLEEGTEDIETLASPELGSSEAYRSYLLIGGDAITGAADVIILAIFPSNGLDPFMVSLPRDLYVENRCTGFARINTTIHGCGDDVTGPELLALTVQDFTGIEVDHFAMFRFSGFRDIVDGIGGVEICVENPVFDDKANLRMPAGCTIANGEQALAWVRSRHTLQNVGGVWKSIPGAGDLLRNQHQQDIILEMAKKLQTFDSPSDLAAKVDELSHAFILDDRLGIGEAIALAWEFRDTDLDSIRRLELEMRLSRTTQGQSVLVPTATFADVLQAGYPEFAAVLLLAETEAR